MTAYCKSEYRDDFIISKEDKDRAYFDTKLLSKKNYDNYKSLLTFKVILLFILIYYTY